MRHSHHIHRYCEARAAQCICKTAGVVIRCFARLPFAINCITAANVWGKGSQRCRCPRIITYRTALSIPFRSSPSFSLIPSLFLALLGLPLDPCWYLWSSWGFDFELRFFTKWQRGLEASSRDAGSGSCSVQKGSQRQAAPKFLAKILRQASDYFRQHSNDMRHSAHSRLHCTEC